MGVVVVAAMVYVVIVGWSLVVALAVAEGILYVELSCGSLQRLVGSVSER